jgi:hypothetical protein
MSEEGKQFLACRARLVDTTDTALTIQLRVGVPSKELSEVQTRLRLTLALYY